MERISWDAFVDETKDRVEELWRSEKAKDKKALVIWIHAEWCGPCRRLEPEVLSFLSEHPEIYWTDIMVPNDDIEKDELKELWDFTTIPSFVIFNDLGCLTMKWDVFKQCALFKD